MESTCPTSYRYATNTVSLCVLRGAKEQVSSVKEEFLALLWTWIRVRLSQFYLFVCLFCLTLTNSCATSHPKSSESGVHSCRGKKGVGRGRGWGSRYTALKRVWDYLNSPVTFTTQSQVWDVQICQKPIKKNENFWHSLRQAVRSGWPVITKTSFACWSWTSSWKHNNFGQQFGWIY